MADDEPVDAQVMSPMGGPSFAVPPWFLAAQQQAQGAPEAAPSPLAFAGGVPNLPPEVMQHLLGSSPPVAGNPQGPGAASPGSPRPAAPPNLPPPKLGSPDALRAAQAGEQRGQQIQEEGLAGQERAQQQLGEAKAGTAEDSAKAIAAQQRDIYGFTDEKGTHQPGLLDKRAADIAAFDKGSQEKLGEFQRAHEAWANTKIDPGRKWASMSTGSKIAAAISIALSGIGMAMARKPGENPALKMIEDAIHDDVQIQGQQQEHLGQVAQGKRQEWQDYKSMGADKLAQSNMVIASRYRQTADDMELAAAQHGSQAAKAQAAMDAGVLRQKAGALVEEASTRTFGQNWQVSEAQRQQKNEDRSAGIQYGHLDLAKKQFEFTKKVHDDTVNEEAAKLELAGRKEDAAELKASHAAVQAGGLMGTDGTYLMNKGEGGKPEPYIIPKENAKEIYTQKAGVLQAVDALDKLRELRRENGGDFNKWGNDARAKAMEYERALVGLHKAAGIAGFRGNVMEVMEKATLGAKDVDLAGHMNSLMPLLEEARGNVVRDFNHTLEGANYNGKPVDIPDPLKAPAAPESIDKQQARTIENATGREHTADGEHSDAYQTLTAWGEEARSPDPAVRKAALEKLDNAAYEGGGSVRIREMARAVYAKALTSHADEAPPEQPKYTAPSYSNFSLPASPTFGGR